MSRGNIMNGSAHFMTITAFQTRENGRLPSEASRFNPQKGAMRNSACV
jgi:hypothetical protein